MECRETHSPFLKEPPLLRVVQVDYFLEASFPGPYKRIYL